MVRLNKINKYIFLVMLGSVCALSSCEKDEGPIMEDPDARLTAELKKNDEALKAAEYGWIATIYPGSAAGNAFGGYSFYVQFLDNNRVRMMGDFNEESATSIMESSYHLKALQRPTLVFDTYNYIHLIHDPDRTISGGDRGEGLLSDFEFSFVEIDADRIELMGTFHYNAMVLEAASREEMEAITGGAWATIRQATSTLVQNSPFLYVEIESGQRVAVEFNLPGKQVSISWMEGDDTAVTRSSNFVYTVDGIKLEAPLKYKDHEVDGFRWNTNHSTLSAVVGESVTPVKVTSNPLIPLHTLFGHDGDYTLLYIDGETLPEGVSSGFNAVYQETVDLLNGSGRGILYTDLTFNDDEQLTVRIRYYTISNGSQYTASKTFEYQKVGNRLTLKEVAMNNNWNSRRNQLAPMTEYLTQTEFIIDWVESSGVGSIPLGGLYPVDDPNTFFYGELR